MTTSEVVSTIIYQTVTSYSSAFVTLTTSLPARTETTRIDGTSYITTTLPASTYVTSELQTTTLITSQQVTTTLPGTTVLDNITFTESGQVLTQTLSPSIVYITLSASTVIVTPSPQTYTLDASSVFITTREVSTAPGKFR